MNLLDIKTYFSAPPYHQRPSVRGAMSLFERFCYRSLACLGKFINFNCLRITFINPQAINKPGGHILAVTHMGNLEPFIISSIARRRIRWMARQEYFARRWMRAILLITGGFPVNRDGVSVSAIRTSINTVKAGEIVGIFPEGGVKKGKEAAIHGGQIKRGVCVVSQRTGAPIVPVVMLGTSKLNKVSPWLPFKRGKVIIYIGEPVEPPLHNLPRRQGRFEMSKRLEQAFVDTYKKILKTDRQAQQDYKPETIP